MRESVDSEFAYRVEAMSGDGDLPSVWTAEHVASRLVEAYATLRQMPLSVRPKDDTGFWPATYDGDVRVEWGHLPLWDQAEIIVARRKEALSKAKTKPDGITIEQASRMEEALQWPIRCLTEIKGGRWQGSEQIMRDAVTLFGLCEGFGLNAATLLSARYKHASAQADRMVITGAARGALYEEIFARCRKEIESDLRSTVSRRKRIVTRYKNEYRARSRPQPHEVVTDLCLTPSAYAKWRQRGCEEIAKALRRARVPVR
jgi:hypothetical protein